MEQSDVSKNLIHEKKIHVNKDSFECKTKKKIIDKVNSKFILADHKLKTVLGAVFVDTKTAL